MRWFYAAITLSLLSAGSWFYYLHQQTRELHDFCSGVSLGTSVVQVRESAQENGFAPTMEPFAQMRVEPAGWMPRPPSCRVFFNRARTVEYRIWQNS